jgi:hypothetical protein
MRIESEIHGMNFSSSSNSFNKLLLLFFPGVPVSQSVGKEGRNEKNSVRSPVVMRSEQPKLKWCLSYLVEQLPTTPRW